MNADLKRPYLGRFAPSATGNLHLGSLVTAIACALEAKKQQGEWLLRIDDLDTPRCSQDSIDAILRCIEVYFDHAPPRKSYQQTQRIKTYDKQLALLIDQQSVYRCTCSRLELKKTQDQTHHTCRQTAFTGPITTIKQDNLASFRFKHPTHNSLELDSILHRKDNCYSYHFSCIIDDYTDGITDIIRGADLKQAQNTQQHLIKALGFLQPTYTYMPLALNETGQKLSKQNKAEPISLQNPLQDFHQALKLMTWPPSATIKTLTRLNLQESWLWAQEHWQLEINQCCLQ